MGRGAASWARCWSEVLAPNQYEKNACVVPGSLERVEYAIVLPGDDSGPVKLPIDSKFPQEDYLRIVEAGERADAAQMEAATNALKRRAAGRGTERFPTSTSTRPPRPTLR